MCTDAYREALTRDLSPTAPAPGQRQAAEADRENAAGRLIQRRPDPGQGNPGSRGIAAAGAAAGNGLAAALAKDAAVVTGEVIDQR
jgi:hypothetical protein